MSNETYPLFANGRPVYPGTKLSVRRSNAWTSNVQTSGAELEARSTYQSQPRYRWVIEYEFGNQAFAQWLSGFFDARQGKVDSFLFVCPLDAQTYRVRFDQDTLDFQHLEVAGHGGVWPYYWTVSVSMRSVLGELA